MKHIENGNSRLNASNACKSFFIEICGQAPINVLPHSYLRACSCLIRYYLRP